MKPYMCRVFVRLGGTLDFSMTPLVIELSLLHLLEPDSLSGRVIVLESYVCHLFYSRLCIPSVLTNILTYLSCPNILTLAIGVPGEAIILLEALIS